MSRRAPDRWPISSDRDVKSGISSRELMPRLTRSAASARRRIGPAMVLARNSESAKVTAAAIRNTRKIAQRSEAMMASMSPPWVESRSAPRMARNRSIGTATETIVSPFLLTRTTVLGLPLEGLGDLGNGAGAIGRRIVQHRQVGVAEAALHLAPGPLDQGALARLGRRQILAQDVAAQRERARIEQQFAPLGRRCGRACGSARRGGAAPGRCGPD